MEKYSLIDLIEEADEKEDDDQETDHQTKRYRLALSILNFVINKPVNEIDNNKQSEILAKLFELPSETKTRQIIDMSEKIDPISLATLVVEDRIEELTSQNIDESTTGAEITDNLEKLEALGEVRYYLSHNDQDQSEFEVSKEISVKKDDINHKLTDSNITPRFTKKDTSKQPLKLRAAKKAKLNKSTRSAQTINRIKNESEPFRVKSENNPINITKPESIPSQALKTLNQTESLISTRQLINNLYTQKKEIPAPSLEAITITEQKTIRVETQKPVDVEPHEPISRYKYLDISKKIIVDNISLNQFFNKNNFNQKARIRIISEILKGETPAKVIGREMRKRGKFKRMAQSYSKANPSNSAFVDNQSSEISSLQPKQLAVKDHNLKQPRIGLIIWSIVILLLIVLIILFMIFSKP
jgi:hypothetical protein